MEQLLLHLFGDYITQNDYLVLNKKEIYSQWLDLLFHSLFDVFITISINN